MFYQAEKLKTSSLSKELCILSVIEILYLWKALPNCSAAKLKTMTQGTQSKRLNLQACCLSFVTKIIIVSTLF